MNSTYSLGTSSVNRPSFEGYPVHGGHAVIPLASYSQMSGRCLPSSPLQGGSGQAMAATPSGHADMDNGGRTTISPPSKVDPLPSKPSPVLASGVDSLVLAIDVTWEDASFFDYLQCQKAIAQQEEKEAAVFLGDRESGEGLLLAIKPYGGKGYEWILQGHDYTLIIGNWLEPKTRPSIMVQIHSVALWSSGPEAAVDSLLRLLSLSGAKIKTVKPSRVDLCVDYLMNQRLWSMNLLKYQVTKASGAAIYFRHRVLTGIGIGSGKIAARLYDKPLEIKQKSQKNWMYTIWGVDSVPDGCRIIRAEVQFRREVIKELGINAIADLFGHLDNLWAYFSKDWLRFENNPHKHHLSRKALPFWAHIQKGFFGVQGACSLIRCQSLQAKRKQLAAQAYGLLNSFIATEHEEMDAPLGYETTLENSLDSFGRYLQHEGKNEFEMNIDILAKRTKYHKVTAKMIAAHQQRKAMDFPCNLPSDLVVGG